MVGAPAGEMPADGGVALGWPSFGNVAANWATSVAGVAAFVLGSGVVLDSAVLG